MVASDACKIFNLIRSAASFWAVHWGIGWLTIACSDNSRSPAQLTHMFCVLKLIAWPALAFCSPSCSLSCLGRVQLFGWEDSPLHLHLFQTDINNCSQLWMMFRFQRGFSRVRLKPARPARLSHKAMAADFDSDIVHTEVKHVNEVITTGIRCFHQRGRS